MLATGDVLSDQELCLFILGGLGHEYESLIVSVTTRSDDLTIDDLQGILLNYEIRLLKNQ